MGHAESAQAGVRPLVADVGLRPRASGSELLEGVRDQEVLSLGARNHRTTASRFVAPLRSTPLYGPPVPFTLAHPAAVIPLLRRPFDGLALVCGAMAPDLPYFIRSTSIEVTAESWYEPFTNATTTHSLVGLVPTTLLLALALYLILRAAVRPMLWLVDGGWNRPSPDLARAMPGRADGPDRVDLVSGRWSTRGVWVPVSLLIGAGTHLLWDSLTSSDGWLAQRFGVLNETAAADLSWVRLGQHASTVIGLAVLGIFMWRRRRSLVERSAGARPRVVWVVTGLTVVGVAAGALSALTRFDPAASPSTRDRIESFATISVKGAGVAVAVAVLVATAGWWLALLRISRSDAVASID